MRAGLISTDQLAAGLRAQVMFGGRLGTNLLELGAVDLDTLGRALGTQHDMPAALAQHFEGGDRELQERLSPETARQLECIPLRHVFGQRHGVVVASTGPLSAGDREQIADELLVAPSHLIPAIAAEMRIKYHLERIYGIVRAPRFLRVRGSIPPLRQRERSDERRRYLEECAEELVAQSRIARGSRDMIPIQLETEPAPAKAPSEVLDAIAHATDRDQLASLVLDTIGRFVPRCDGAAILLSRGRAAYGWRALSRSGAAAQHLVVSLDGPGLLPAAVATAATQRGGSTDMHAADQILLHMIGSAGELVVIPLAIGGHVPALLACAVAPGAAVDLIEQCATAAASALGRLVRAAAARPASEDIRA